MGKLNVDGTEIQVLQIEEDDYISLTDMVRKIDNGPALIEKWLRNKNTIEFLGIWEEMYNAGFNAAAYEEIMLEAGLNRFIMSVKQWVSRTNSKGIVAKAGRYGGTYAYKDIAFEFASWVSPQFKFIEQHKYIKSKTHKTQNQQACEKSQFVGFFLCNFLFLDRILTFGFYN